MEAAQKELAAAIENGDAQAQVEANKRIATLAFENAKLEQAKAGREEQQAEKPVLSQPPVQTQQMEDPINPDPKAEAWAEKNEWFGKDEVMTASAFAIHNNLEAEGFDTGSDEYYNAVDRQLREYFPEKFSDAQPKKTGGGNQVAPAGSSASRNVKSGRRTVKLSPSQVAMAKKLNVPLDRYAKEFLKTSEKANN